MTAIVVGAVGLALAVQSMQATVTGIVRDGEHGTALRGAMVRLPDLDRVTTTGEDGRYVLTDVPAGPQHLVVQSMGYEPRTLHALVPPSGRLEIHVTLRPAPIELGTIEVRPPIALRGVEADAAAGAHTERGLTQAALRNHPQLAEPDAFRALAGGEVVVAPEMQTGVHIRGGASDHTAFVLDGIPVFSPYHAAGVFSAWNPDALARIDLVSIAPSPRLPDALAGVIAGTTRRPGPLHGVHSSVSTAQARVTVDGPLGGDRAGYMLSLRTAVPPGFGGTREGSYITSEAGDLFAKLEAPALGGTIRLLRYENENEIDAASRVTPSTAAGVPAAAHDARRNAFAWRSASTGASWSRAFSGLTLDVTAWSAHLRSRADWTGADDGPVRLSSGRHDAGLVLTATQNAARTHTQAGVRLEHRRASYQVAGDPAAAPAALETRMPLAAAFVEHARVFGSQAALTIGGSATHAAGGTQFSPRIHVRWTPRSVLTVSGGLARLHQYAQSLRNAESVVGMIFPADLHTGAGAGSVPVARSDQAVAAVELRPGAGLRVSAQAWTRVLDGLVLVAPHAGGPFVSDELALRNAIGSGRARGIAVEASLSRTRYGLVASWGWQRVRLVDADVAWVPDHGARQTVEAGAIVFPSVTSSVRAGVTGVFGRRTTAIPGGFEFESCNLIDGGCEFAGSPDYTGAVLGGAALPAYVRVDLGARKHWDLDVAGRHAMVAVFGTVTNVFARDNLLTWAIDAETGERTAVDLRPISPLVIGLDWRF